MEIKTVEFDLGKKNNFFFRGNAWKITNLQDWTKTKIFKDGKEIKSLIRSINICIESGETTRITVVYHDFSKPKDGDIND